jgi:hypothetical protein
MDPIVPVKVVPGPRPARGRRRAALIVAVAADLLQLPAGLAMVAATLSVAGAAADIPLDAIEVAIDVTAAVILNRLLGFHWQLLPTFVLKALPFADLAPTWTVCTWYLLKRQERNGT